MGEDSPHVIRGQEIVRQESHEKMLITEIWGTRCALFPGVDWLDEIILYANLVNNLTLRNQIIGSM